MSALIEESLNSRPVDLESIEAIVKTSERCNIACKYCYFFFGGDDSYRHHPPFISHDTVMRTAIFLRDGAIDASLKRVVLTFHGGEPLMLKPARFRQMCRTFVDVIAPHAQVVLQVQTNGMLVDEEWIDLFAEFDMAVGVSIDGPAHVHDEQRIDHRGRGTHERVMAGLDLLRAARRAGRIPHLGGLAVIDPGRSAESLFRYMFEELGLDAFDFIPPFGELNCAPSALGRFMCDLFDAWLRHGDEQLRIPVLESFINKLNGWSSFYNPCGQDPIRHRVFRVSSDGTLYPDENLPAGSWSTPKVSETSLDDFLRNDYYALVDNLHNNDPTPCQSCCWREVCHGGHPWNRRSPSGQFDVPSSLCEGLKQFYAHVVRYLFSTGTPAEVITRRLKLADA